MMKIVASLAVISMMVISCGNAEEKSERKNGFTHDLKTKADSLYYDVMQGHDIGMAKTGAITKAITKAQTKLDSLQKLASSKIDKAYQEQVTSLKEMLVNAQKGMNTWMEEFNADSAVGAGASIDYLESQKAKVTIVKDDILKSLEKADSLLKK
ncbi:hypothetical protein HHL16_04750 [Pseudoflavitalea sp. G-6-1-2]|uniref:hypothetical protein n=1 Tax=Pseudoflavitalea sp. G-6-1-2 TaxID=2728841 RepID=UPI00146B101A|nr:hypothetical protein [Pseudoflavitalea sp. G-6-1-2]NML20167.1 hypothetical protein [Pseudoflavitalea sp. G-6-1-2]